MNKFLVLSSCLCFGGFTHTTFAANCTVEANTKIVNINQFSGITAVNFLNCKNRIYFRHEFLNTSIRGKYNDPTLVLDSNPNTYIELPFYARVGANWRYGGASSSVTMETNNYYPNSDSYAGTMYVDMSLSQFGDLSTYPIGTYRTSITYSAIEY